MAMPQVVPASAVGYYVLVRPGEFWNSAWLDGDYAKVAQTMIRMHGGTRENLLAASVTLIFRSSIAAIDPEMRDLPLAHPQRQQMLRLHKVALATFAYLMDARYFALILDEGYNQCRFERIPATSVKHAQQLIVERADVQAIESRHPPSWTATMLH